MSASYYMSRSPSRASSLISACSQCLISHFDAFQRPCQLKYLRQDQTNWNRKIRTNIINLFAAASVSHNKAKQSTAPPSRCWRRKEQRPTTTPTLPNPKARRTETRTRTRTHRRLQPHNTHTPRIKSKQTEFYFLKPLGRRMDIIS